MTSFKRLYRRRLPPEWEKSREVLQGEIEELQRAVNDLSSVVEFGPVPGAYIPLCFRLEDSSGFSGGETTYHYLNFPSRPVYASIWADNNMSARITWRESSTSGTGLELTTLVVITGGSSETSNADPKFWDSDMDDEDVLDPGVYELLVTVAEPATVLTALLIVQVSANPADY